MAMLRISCLRTGLLCSFCRFAPRGGCQFPGLEPGACSGPVPGGVLSADLQKTARSRSALSRASGGVDERPENTPFYRICHPLTPVKERIVQGSSLGNADLYKDRSIFRWLGPMCG